MATKSSKPKKMRVNPTRTTPKRNISEPKVTYVYRKDAFKKVKIA